MASILDSGLAGIFTKIFIFLLVYALVYGVMSARKMFGDKAQGLYAMIALVIALLAAIAPQTEAFISTVAPYYVAMFLVIFFILFIVSMFGLTAENDFPKIIRDNRVYTWILIFAILIFVIGLGTTFGPGLTPGNAQQTQTAQIDPSMDVIGGSGVPYAEPGTLSQGQYVGARGAQSVQAGQPGSTATNDFGTNLVNTIFHPKVLGLLVTLLIAAVSVYFLSTQA